MKDLPFDLDPRVTLYDVVEQQGALTGVADAALRDELNAYANEQGLRLEVTYLAPSRRRIVTGRTPLFAAPSSASATVSDVGFGEDVEAFDTRDGFVRIAVCHDRYLGWVPEAAVGALPHATHALTALRAHVYSRPRVSAARLLPLAYGAPLHRLSERDGWAEVSLSTGTGFVQRRLVEASPHTLEPNPESIVAFALRFLETPYVWGGVSAWGLDCSGLVQTVYRAHGVSLPRDSDQQVSCGEAVEVTKVRPADLLFFPGHVALSLGGERFLHANAHHMGVSIDSFADGGYGGRLGSQLTTVRRVLP